MLQISLRQILTRVAAIAIAIVSIRYSTRWWHSVVGLAVLLSFFAAGITAIFERGPRQAFAIGFAVVVFGYAVMLAGGRKSYGSNGNALTYEELHGAGYVPTTICLGELYDFFHRQGGGRTAPLIAGRPSQSNFARTGHTWWALLLGYLGGHFARFVYLRRVNEYAPPTKE
jgi:hypothetical protein